MAIYIVIRLTLEVRVNTSKTAKPVIDEIARNYTELLGFHEIADYTMTL